MTNHQIIFRENKLYSIYSSQLQLLFHQPYFYISCLVLLPCISTWLCRDTTEPAKNPEGEKKKRCVMYVGVGSSPSFSSPFFLLPYTMKNHLLATFQAHIQSWMLARSANILHSLLSSNTGWKVADLKKIATFVVNIGLVVLFYPDISKCKILHFEV